MTPYEITYNDRPYYSDFHDAWFFYDECGDTHGPFKTYFTACKAQKRYIRWLNGTPNLIDRLVFWWHCVSPWRGTMEEDYGK